MTSNGRIPFLDLVAPHLELEAELLSIFRTALRTGRFVGGQMVEDFEREFGQYCETRYCVGVASGTDALRFALIAVGVRPGDTVVTVPNTFIATTEAISQAGARPEFVDIDEHSYNMDPGKLREYVETRCYIHPTTGKLSSERTKQPVAAIVPVHLYGQMADMGAILELAEQYQLTVIEDACQAHGAEYFPKTQNRWRKAGSMGRAAAFSFYPGKNLGACGEAGAVTTDDKDVLETVQKLRDHGQAQKYCHEIQGYNGRLDAIQAGILRTKLAHLPEWNRHRRQNAQCYDGLFTQMHDSIKTPYEPTWARAVYHHYVIRARNRDQLRAHLAEAGIGTGIHYPVPLHLQKAYKTLGYKQGDFPVTEKVSSQILSLPVYPQLRFDQQLQVANAVMDFVSVKVKAASG